MKRNIVRTICFATLCLALPAVAPAQGHRACSNAGLAGAWGYTETGTVIHPTAGAVAVAAVGIYTFDHAGNFSGTQYSSSGGTVVQDTKEGTYTVDADCTATLTLSVFNQSGTLLRKSVWQIVLVENATEMRGIMTSLVVQPSGPNVPPIVTLSAKRLVPSGRGKEKNDQ
jgi:hypothetical protein